MPETQEQPYEAIVPLTAIKENEPGFCINDEYEDDDIGISTPRLVPENVSGEPQIGAEQLQSISNAILVDPITVIGPATPAAPRPSHPQTSHKPVEWVTTKEDLTASFTTQKKKDVSLTPSSANHSEELGARQVFLSKELQEKLSMLAIKKKFEFKVQRSSRKLLVLSCIDDNCQWRLWACRYRDGTSFQIRTIVKGHTFSAETCYNEHRQASSWVIGQHIKSKCQGMNRTFKPKEIIEEVRREFGVNLSYEKAWRAREVALNSDGGPHRRHASGLSSGWPKKRKEPSSGEDQTAQQKELSAGEDQTARQNVLSAGEDRTAPKCGNCGEVGQYRKTCPIPIVPPLSSTSGGEAQDKVAEN